MMTTRILLAAVTLSVTLLPRTSYGYCRTNTCEADPEDPDCYVSSESCLEGGVPLYWDRACLSFSVSAEGSPLRGISYEEAAATIDEAMRSWTAIECPEGGKPALAVDLYPAVTCESLQFNTGGPNANAWLFRDDLWPYTGAGSPAQTLALTTVTFNARTGEILDADVEINSAENKLTTGDNSDLLAIATHEAGHVLGLAHSNSSGSTMWAFYAAPHGSAAELSPDDAAGICDAYPPGAVPHDCNFDPEGGFTPTCYSKDDSGCSFTGHRPAGTDITALIALVGAACGLRLRRRCG